MFFFGFAIEIIQSSLGRDLDFGDVYRNCLGSALAVFFLSPSARLESSKIILAVKVLLTLLLIVQLFYPLRALVDEFRAEADFPILADFESTAELTRWSSDVEVSIAHDLAFNGRQSLKAVLGTSQYSGLSLNHFPGDWQAYTHFQLHLYREKPLTVTVRINDHEHRLGKQPFDDRFNKSYAFRYAGWNVRLLSI